MFEEMEPVDWDGVLKKLANIKALADRGGTLAEAEVASAMMAKLLLRYNLTLMDVERHANEGGRAVATEDITATTAGWKRLLLSGVAIGHLCRAIFRGGRATLIGHAHNLIVVRETFPWLVVEINRLCDTAYGDALARDDAGARTSPRSWKNDFRVGAAVGVDGSYRRMQREAEREAPAEEWALIPVMAEEVDALMRELFPTLRVIRPGLGWVGGYAAGEAAGTQINLDRQLVDASRA